MLYIFTGFTFHFFGGKISEFFGVDGVEQFKLETRRVWKGIEVKAIYYFCC